MFILVQCLQNLDIEKGRREMKFCPIIPTGAFQRFSKASDHWMALAQYLHISEYRQFFQKKLADGEVVILDNGAYEDTPMPMTQLNYWTLELKPSVLVLPDVPGKCLNTLVAAGSYLRDFGLPHGTEGMMVLHAQDGKLEHFIAAYELCPVEWVGFSRLTKSFDAELSAEVTWHDQRVAFANILRERGLWRRELKHHALGMLSGDVTELTKLSYVGFHSCDSSAPVWRGLHGYSTNDPTWPNYAFEPLAPPEANNFDLAEQNLAVVLSACHGQS